MWSISSQKFLATVLFFSCVPRRLLRRREFRRRPNRKIRTINLSLNRCSLQREKRENIFPPDNNDNKFSAVDYLPTTTTSALWSPALMKNLAKWPKFKLHQHTLETFNSCCFSLNTARDTRNNNKRSRCAKERDCLFVCLNRDAKLFINEVAAKSGGFLLFTSFLIEMNNFGYLSISTCFK